MRVTLYPADILRRQTVPVTRFDDVLALLIETMRVTLWEARGVGLAAPQVGSSLSLFLAKPDDGDALVFINPEIVGTSIETESCREGCLSLPGVYEEVTRPIAVTVQASNAKGRSFRMDCEGLLARIVQHEIDHLNGVLFIDHLSPVRRNWVLQWLLNRATKESQS